MQEGDHLKPLPPQERLVDAVYARLREAILDSRLPPATPLSVPELARRLKVSRSPVREAVLQLTAEGLAEELPRHGATVACLGFEDLLAVHDLREVLEGLAARLAAENASARDVERLNAILEEQTAAVAAHDATQYERTNQSFHETIASLSGNSRLRRMLRVLYDQQKLAIRAAAAEPRHIKLGHGEHRRIVTAIHERDGLGAEAAMRQHFRRTRPHRSGQDKGGDPP